MRPSTARRTLVFVVCLAGVAALYWVPTAVRTPQRLGSPAAPPAPSTRSYEPSPAPTETVTVVASDPADPSTGPVPAPPAETDAAGPTSSPTATASAPTPRSAPSTPAATTAAPVSTSPSERATTEPSPSASATTPGRVHNLHVVESDHEGLVVAWNPVRDAAAYQVVLNGYSVGGTTGTAVALRWFNDDMSQHYVQVRAVGSDGRRSDDAAYLPVTRPVDPTPEPTPTPTASASTAGEPPTPSPSASR